MLCCDRNVTKVSSKIVVRFENGTIGMIIIIIIYCFLMCVYVCARMFVWACVLERSVGCVCVCVCEWDGCVYVNR